MKVTSRMYRSTVPLLLLVAAVAGGVAFAQGQQQVEFWIVWDQIGQFREILAPFHEANPDISVNVSLSPQGVALRERLTVAVAGGAPPDLVLVVSPAADMMMSGLFLELDEFIAASETIGPEAYPPGLFELFSWDGHQYAVPGIEGGPWSGLVVNERLLAEVGLVEPPQTLEDLQTYHRRLTRYEDDQLVRIGFSPLNAMTGTYPADIWTRIFDVSLYDPDANYPGQHSRDGRRHGVHPTVLRSNAHQRHRSFPSTVRLVQRDEQQHLGHGDQRVLERRVLPKPCRSHCVHLGPDRPW